MLREPQRGSQATCQSQEEVVLEAVLSFSVEEEGHILFANKQTTIMHILKWQWFFKKELGHRFGEACVPE